MRAGFSLAIGLVCAGWALGGETVHLESGPKQVSVLELYTSQGCSSCPPAEAALAALKDDPGLWKRFVPIGFHVDYWDSLGWADPYAKPEFTKRQHAYAEEWKSSAVYTPEFALNGKEWKPHGKMPLSDGEPGSLTVNVMGRSVEVVFRPTKKPGGPLSVILVPLGNHMVTAIGRGENAGKKLDQEFVALDLLREPLAPKEDGTYTGALTLPEGKTTSALAAWVCEEGSQTPLQATGGPIR